MKTIVITGSSSGIGKAIYKWAEKSGYNVIGISREKESDIVLDLSQTNFPELESAIKSKLFGSHIDILINCAGIMPFLEDRKTMDTNFWGVVNMTKAGVHHMPVLSPQDIRCGQYCIINIASVSGSQADPELPIYAASKAAVISYTKSLAKKLAPGIRVNCISPGFYKTNLVPEDTPEELINTVPMGFEEEPKNIIPIIKMILETKYMTGANIVVDGGVSL